MGASTEPRGLEFTTFLRDHPPGSEAPVTGLRVGLSGSSASQRLMFPSGEMLCPSDACGGVRQFDSGSDFAPLKDIERVLVVQYSCRNCNASTRFFAIRLWKVKEEVCCYKIGEYPPFGPPVPESVLALLGDDRHVFLKGRRAENQGLGIGAFAYYRRVIDNQWQRLLDRVIAAAKISEVPESSIELLQAAAKEQQFKKAVDMVRDVVPEAIKLNGQNPLTLLYSATSEAIHAMTDEECLSLATDVRLVLTEMVARMDQIIKKDAEIRGAVDRLRSHTASPAVKEQA